MKRIICFLLSIIFVLSAAPVSPAASGVVSAFADVSESSWYYDAVVFLHNKGYMNGTSEDTFSPDIPLSRGMLMCILGVINKVDKSEFMYSYFNDCTVDQYYTPYVTWAYENGVASGTGDKMFSPNDPVTREQMTVFITQIMEYRGLDTAFDASVLNRYSDAVTVSEWAVDAVCCCICNSIISGVSGSEISPRTVCTRAQTAVILYRLFNDYLDNQYQNHYDFMVINKVFKSASGGISEKVSRKFFAETIVNATGFSDALNYYVFKTGSDRRFTDMKGGRATANAEIAVAQGYMVCDENEFRPDDDITYGEVMRGLIWAIGYREYSDDYDTLEFAHELELDKYVVQKKEYGASVSMGEFASILRKSLFTNSVICYKNKDGEYRVRSRGDNTYLYRLYVMDTATCDIVHLANGGWDIFGGGGWRYGPSMIINGDGSIDMWLAGNASSYGEVDWGYHKTSYDGGLTFTQDKASVCPTYASEDWNWCCDPSVFKMGDYYYAGYTSICWRQGYDNNLFIARSKDPDDFTSEKWNGVSWGGSQPKAAITFDGLYHCWGCGEPSFVVKDDTVYCYVTWTSDNAARKVYTAPANDPNWPGKLKLAGTAIYVSDPNEDSIDVKYADAYGQFIAVCTANRMADGSFIRLYTSFDGVTFRRENVIKGEDANLVVDGIHNIGITGDERGHIDIFAQNYVCFAYTAPSDKWGSWHTRFVPITLFGGLNYGKEENVIASEDPDTVTYAVTDPDAPVRIVSSKTTYSIDAVGKDQALSLYYYTQSGGIGYLDDLTDPEIRFIYDHSVISLDREAGTFRLLKMAGAGIIVYYKGALTTVRATPVNHRNYKPVSIRPENSTVVFEYQTEKKQNGTIVSNGIGDYLMVWGDKLSSYNVYSNGLDSSVGLWSQTVRYSGYDGRVVSIHDDGIMTAQSPGRTTVIVTYGDLQCDFEVIVPEEIFAR